MSGEQPYKRQWRAYKTQSGACPVKDFLETLASEDAQAVALAMKEVAVYGLASARHLRGDIYEVRADGNHQTFRILFATEGRYHQILLSLEAFSKKTLKTSTQKIELAEKRLADWRKRGQ
jgi:phage-related protein